MANQVRRRQCHLVEELARRGGVFLPEPSGRFHLNLLWLLIHHGFFSLFREVGVILAERELGKGSWHAFGDSSKPGLWCAQRPESEKDAAGKVVHGYQRTDLQCMPMPLLLQAVQRDFPNLEIVKMLVEKFHVDVNETPWTIEHKITQREHVRGDSALHYVSRGWRWWHVHQAMEYLLGIPGIDINLQCENGHTPLHMALSGGDASHQGTHSCDAVRLLLKAGADIHIKTSHGRSCLEMASQDIKKTRMLLEHGAEVESDDITAAIQNGNIEVLQEMLSWVRENKPSENKDTLGVDIDPCLLAAGMLFRRHDDDEDSYVLQTVDEETATEMVKVLIQHGANPARQYWAWFDETSRYKFRADKCRDFIEGDVRPAKVPKGERKSTMLHELVSTVERLPLRVFLTSGFDINHQDARGQTILMRLCGNRNACLEFWNPKKDVEDEGETVFNHLIAIGADLNTQDDRGETVLSHMLRGYNPCSYPKWEEVLDKIIHLAPNLIHQPDKNGQLPLVLAAERVRTLDDTEAITAMLLAGALPSAADDEGDSALHILAKEISSKSHRDLVRLLVARGADINCRNLQGETPLFRFAFRDGRGANFRSSETTIEDPEAKLAMELFQELGADFFAKDNEGRGLLHVAATGAVERFQELMAVGLDPMMENNAQHTAIDVAAACSNNDILEIFEKKAKR